MQNRFGTTASYTVGVEEEFQLVAPSTLQLAPAVEAVIGAMPDGSELLGRELFQDCVEMRTPVFATIAELGRDGISPPFAAGPQRRRTRREWRSQPRRCTRSPTPSRRALPAGSATSGWRRN